MQERDVDASDVYEELNPSTLNIVQSVSETHFKIKI